MGHVRKDTLTKPIEYWKHLKWRKRVQSRKERIAAKQYIQKEVENNL